MVDAQSGVAIPNVTVSLRATSGGKHRPANAPTTQTDASGRFTFAALPAGTYRLALARDGYQPTLSALLRVGTLPVSATLAMQRGSGNLQVIATTAVHSGSSLVQASSFSKTLDAETLQQQGIVRAADALRTLPGVNNGITGDTAALADDVNVSLRGIGTLETIAAVDGHPIAYGIKGGFNYQLSPVYPYRNVSVLYGSGGSDVLGVNAIGGVIDFSTLDPTPSQRVTFTQGYGTFRQLSTSLTGTGTVGKLGYALAFGTSGLDGPFHNDSLYQAGAAFDQSVASGPIHDLGIYPDDGTAVTRASLVKFSYALSPQSTLTATSIGENRWANKTGNGDGDYLAYAPALAFGKELLAKYKPSSYPTLAACPAGTFVGTNANGAPNGFGPNGLPDGGTTCQTPQQYAAFNTGWDGAGPSWQSLRLNDNTLDFNYTGERSAVHASVYNSSYANLTDRTFRLPFVTSPGDVGSWSNIGVNETGAIADDDLLARNNDVTLGASYMNDTYFTYSKNSLKGAPVISETAYFARDTYHAQSSPLLAYLDLWAKHSTATDTSYLDSRLSAVYRLGPHDVVRASAGSTTTQPSANMIDTQFIESLPGGAGGGAPITCAALNSIGSAPSSVLKPEKGVDEDLAYVHRWHDDTQTQITLYNTNVYDKIYSTTVPLSQTGTAFVPPSYLALATAAVAGHCGTNVAPGLLGVSGFLNVGTLRARGADIAGRLRATRSLYVDYDWALTSTVLGAANTALLESTPTLIPDSQLPRLPLHTFNAAVDYTLHDGIDLRYTLYTVSSNNTKALPAYDYSDLSAGYPVGKGILTATVLNLFNQWGSIAGLRYEGVPLPLNSYAPKAAYAQYTGAAATELFGLPYRTLYLSYQFRM